jgi:hypothetical protein
MITVVVYEIYDIKKDRREIKEMFVMICFCLLSLIYGLIYIINPTALKLATITFNWFGG